MTLYAVRGRVPSVDKVQQVVADDRVLVGSEEDPARGIDNPSITKSIELTQSWLLAMLSQPGPYG